VIDGGVLARGGSAVLVLAGPAPTAVDGSTARWRLDLEAGESIAFALQYSTAGRRACRCEHADLEVGDTVAFVLHFVTSSDA